MEDRINGFDPHHGIDFDDAIPRPGPEVFILRLKANQAFTFIILGEKIRGLWIHWSGKNSEPHFKDSARCPGCQKHQGKKWKGYLHVFTLERGQEMFLELTAFSADSLMHQLGRSQSLRGNRIRVQRGKGDNGRLTIATMTAHNDVKQLPAERDPRNSIMKLYGFDEATLAEMLGSEYVADPLN